MSSLADKPVPRRKHDAEGSRCALLAAARDLFDERGFEATTVRDIGERAAVDPALISRYFGGKEALYRATLGQDDDVPIPGDPAGAFAALLARTEERGIGPIGRAMVSPTLSASMRGDVCEVVRSRVLAPLAAELRASGIPDPEMRAELVLAMAIGISLTRASGTLPCLAEASAPEILALVEPMLDALRAEPHTA